MMNWPEMDARMRYEERLAAAARQRLARSARATEYRDPSGLRPRAWAWLGGWLICQGTRLQAHGRGADQN